MRVHRFPALFLAGGLALMIDAGCARSMRNTAALPAAPADHTQLWVAPDDIATRDLFNGPGGTALTPSREPFQFVARDTTGKSPGFDVKDASGREWSVKLGPEAQSEVVTSRVLWAMGFHQPATYFVDQWTMKGAEAGISEGPQQPGRFRPELPDVETIIGDWSWYENPFVGTRPFGGLVVANLLLNSWDWKTSNNKIYDLKAPGQGPTRRYVVRDLGASLGKTSYPTLLKWFRLRGFGQGTKNDLAGFEAQAFLLPSDDGTLHFDYRGIYGDVVKSVSSDDVRWTCELLSRLTDAQWDDAFRAGGYTPDERARYVRKIKAKIAEGLAHASSQVGAKTAASVRR